MSRGVKLFRNNNFPFKVSGISWFPLSSMRPSVLEVEDEARRCELNDLIEPLLFELLGVPLLRVMYGYKRNKYTTLIM